SLPGQGALVTQLSTLDRAELTAWLTRVTQTIDRSLRDTVRAEALLLLSAELDGATASVPVLAQLALLDDCLRVAHFAIEADGRIEPDELARVTDLIQLAAPKYFAVLPRYESFDEGAPTPEEVERFFVAHRDDTGAFGYAGESTWRGLHLVRLVERRTRNAAPLRELERMLVRIMDEVFAGRASAVERDARRKLRDLFEPPPSSADDGGGSNRSRSLRRASRSTALARPANTSSMIRTSMRSSSRSGAALRV